MKSSLRCFGAPVSSSGGLCLPNVLYAFRPMNSLRHVRKLHVKPRQQNIHRPLLLDPNPPRQMTLVAKDPGRIVIFIGNLTYTLLNYITGQTEHHYSFGQPILPQEIKEPPLAYLFTFRPGFQDESCNYHTRNAEVCGLA